MRTSLTSRAISFGERNGGPVGPPFLLSPDSSVPTLERISGRAESLGAAKKPPECVAYYRRDTALERTVTGSW